MFLAIDLAVLSLVVSAICFVFLLVILGTFGNAINELRQENRRQNWELRDQKDEDSEIKNAIRWLQAQLEVKHAGELDEATQAAIDDLKETVRELSPG